MWNIGPHIINNVASVDLLKRWNPSSMTILDGDINYIKAIREVLPDTHINVRIYYPDGEISDRIKNNPIDAARYYRTKILERYGSVLSIVSTFQIENEILQDTNSLPFLTQYALEHMQLADSSGYKLCIFNFSVGNPDIPNWALLTNALSYAENNNHVIGIHQYGKPPSFWTIDPDWLISRLENKVLTLLSFKKLKFLVCEYGLDNLLYGNGTPGGYKLFISVDNYFKQIVDMSNYTTKFSDRIIGYNLFTFGSNNPWQSYDINGELANKLADYGNTLTQIDKPVTSIFLPIIQVNMNNKITYAKAKPYLNFRDAPSTNGNILDTIYPYTPIELIEDGEWARIKYNDIIGYVKSSYLANENERYLFNYALQHNIDFLLLMSILLVESNNKAFRLDGELVLRFELHIFKNYFAANPINRKLFDDRFSLNNNTHYILSNNQWVKYHDAGVLELQAFNFAKQLNEQYALLSTSFGIPQLMGFNHKLVGFNTVFDLVNFLKESELNHYKTFIAFLEGRNVINYIKDYNFNKIAELYNGFGNVNVYSKLIQDKYRELKYGN